MGIALESILLRNVARVISFRDSGWLAGHFKFPHEKAPWRKYKEDCFALLRFFQKVV